MLRNIFKNQEGAVAILTALSMFVLIMAIGVAIDMSRADTVKSKIQTALDSAALAAARTINDVPAGETTEQWVNSQAQIFFNANFPSGYLQTNSVTLSPAQITYTATGVTISLSASTQQKTMIMGTANVHNVNIGDSTQVTTGSEGVELVLVLDNTGSMNDPVNPQDSSVSKLSALKTAANELVSILYGTGTNPPANVFTGIVPFSQAVNIGTQNAAWLGSAPTDFPSNSPWYGCVTARSQPYDILDTTPNLANGSESFFQAYLYPNSNSQSLPASEQSTLNVWPNTNPTESQGAVGGPNAYCPQPLTPMTNIASTLTSNINNMTAQGDTLLDIGLAWGQRMLSPKWNGTWGGSMSNTGSTAHPSLPLPYNTPGMQKVVVLMTDGWNHVYPFNYTAYNFGYQGNIGGATDEASEENNLNNYTKQVCDTMKSNNIIIYTIGLGTGDTGGNSSSSTVVDGDLLKYCATDSNHYFLAPTNGALITAFSTIANQVANLRVSK